MAHYEDKPKTPHIEDEPESLRGEVVGRFVDIFKKAVSTGASVIFSDKDKDDDDKDKDKEKRSRLELPKEILQYLFSTVDGMQEAVLKIIGHEVSKFLEHVDLGGELQKILTSTSFEIKTEIRFIPNDQAVVSPSIKAKIRAKRNKDGKEEDILEEEV
jgi:hypothetical protein